MLEILAGNKALIDPAQLRLWRLRKTIITSARLIQDRMQFGRERFKVAMVTLTYRDVEGWREKHISAYLKSLREWSRRRNFRLRYVWVAELQKRGAVHYHVLVWLPRGVTMPKADARGWWPHGMTKTEWARKPVGYVAKYASKGHNESGANFPKGCRIYGVGGLEGDQKDEVRWWNFPKWVRLSWPMSFRPYRNDPYRAPSLRRAKGGGVVNLGTGEIVQSEWGFSGLLRYGAHRLVAVVMKAAQADKRTRSAYAYARPIIAAIEKCKASISRELLTLSRVDWLMSLPAAIRNSKESDENWASLLDLPGFAGLK